MSKVRPRLSQGDEVRVICPSSSLDASDTEKRERVASGLNLLGLKVSFSRYCFTTHATPEQRVEDLYAAFADEDIRAIWAGTGGFNSIELLPHIDFGRLKNKIFCGYSDITVLLNAIYSQTGFITYHGPNAGGFGQNSFTDENVRKTLFTRDPFMLESSKQWLDTTYDNGIEHSYKNDGWWPLNTAGIVEGTLIGGNITCFSLLKSTAYMPKLKGSILLVEDDHESQAHHFIAQFESLILHDKFDGVEAILIGRFQKASGINRSLLQSLVDRNEKLRYVPVIANIDFGHTKPQHTLPIGGIVQVTSLPETQSIKIVEH